MRLVSLILLTGLLEARLFDSIVGYRQGSNGVNTDTTKYPHQVEEPVAPASLDNLFGYTSSQNDRGVIDIVHCYSMRNGLYGGPTEARVFWSRLDPTTYRDSYRQGSAETIRAVSFAIDNPVTQFAVNEPDLTAFVMSQVPSSLRLTLHVVPGPDVSHRKMRSFSLNKLASINFTVASLLVLSDASKLIFYGKDHLGEISLANYPF